MTSTLQQHAGIFPGHSIRGSIADYAAGSIRIIQRCDINAAGNIAWQRLKAIKTGRRALPPRLRENDILIPAEGESRFALCLPQAPHETIYSSDFLLLRVSDKALLPAFLAWQINQPPAQEYLRANANRNHRISVDILQNLPLKVPLLALQQQLLHWQNEIARERRLYRQTLQNRARQIQSATRRMLA